MDNQLGKRRRNISIPEAVDERLRKDKHASQTIVDALERYWAGWDSAKTMAKLTQDNTEALNELAETLATVEKRTKHIVNWMNAQGANIGL